jgi:hypothetical protein
MSLETLAFREGTRDVLKICLERAQPDALNLYKVAERFNLQHWQENLRIVPGRTTKVPEAED